MKALISVSNKKGITDFASVLASSGWEVISTGGTLKQLEQAGINVIPVSEYTGREEVLDGRVKTLDQKIFAGILARRDQEEELSELSFPRIDLVCCNFYPFEKAVKSGAVEQDIIENIDIGGVSLVRAAAKNYMNVIVVSDPEDYSAVAEKIKADEEFSAEYRKHLAKKAFKRSSNYERTIYDYFSVGDSLEIKEELSLTLRYGENSHQPAAFYGELPYKKIGGNKDLSFNNIQDTDAAYSIITKLETDSSVIIKHLVPCGAATSTSSHNAYLKALEADPESAFGGIIAFNSKLGIDTAEEISKRFYEIVLAPSYDKRALEKLSEKENLRILKYDKIIEKEMDIRTVSGGFLSQTPDSMSGEEWVTVTSRGTDERELADLQFAWNIVSFLKSNAIALVHNMQTVGLGAGETSRLSAVEIAASKYKKFFDCRFGNLVMASDAFFPFPDAVEEAAKIDVTAIVQPGGSKNDNLVIEAAEDLGISMIFTGRRHFLH